MVICCIAYEVCLGERSCTFSDGYLVNGGADSKYMGRTDTEHECAIKVIYLEPAAIGASWYPTEIGGEVWDPLGLILNSPAAKSAGFTFKHICMAVFGGEIRFEDTASRSCIFQEYEHFSRSCVHGNNIVKYTGKSVSSCKDLCSARPDCLAFEYGVSYGGIGSYQPKDCQLQSSRDTTECDGSHFNLDVYIRNSVPRIFAYWDYGSCGPQGDDSNWEWCDKRGGGPCQNEVTTSQCTSGTALLSAVNGHQQATRFSDNYVLNGCKYAYYAIYTCKEYTAYENLYCWTSTSSSSSIYKSNPTKLADTQTGLTSATAMCKLDPTCDQFYFKPGYGFWKCNNKIIMSSKSQFTSNTGFILYKLLT